MTVVIVGAVAAGTKVAAKLKRELGDACQVILLERRNEISYSGCGLPYYVEGVVKDIASLYLNTPEEFAQVTGTQLRCGAEVTAVDRAGHTVQVRDVQTGRTETLAYDKLVLAVGASPSPVPVEGAGLPGVFHLRTPADAQVLREAVDKGMRRAVILGGGPVGLELASCLKEKGVRSVVLDAASQILPGFDPDFAAHVEDCLMENGVPVFTGQTLTSIEGEGKVEMVRTQNRRIRADAVILAAGVRPNTEFLKDTGLAMTPRGALVVDEHMTTSDPDICAVGDCAAVTNRLTGQRQWAPLGSVAAITGRVCAQALAGQDGAYPGVLGTTLLKTCGVNVSKTGLCLADAKAAGFDAVAATVSVDDRVPYYPGAGVLTIRAVADRATHRLLGVQAAGPGPVDKIADVAVACLCHGATLESMQCMDLSYAPPFSTAIHPLTQAVNVLLNKVEGKMTGVNMDGFRHLPPDTLFLDVMKTAHIPQYTSVPVRTIHGALEGVDKNRPIALVCEKGKQGYLAQNKLRRYGYTNTVVLEGGLVFNRIDE